MVKYVKNWLRYKHNLSELEALSDKTLKDIGLTRCEVRRAAYESVYDKYS